METYIKKGFTIKSMHLCQPLLDSKVSDSTALNALVSKYYVGLKDDEGANWLGMLIRTHTDHPKGKEGPLI